MLFFFVFHFVKFIYFFSPSFLFRENSSEVFRLRSQLEDSRDQTDTLKRENKNISLEIKDLLDQLGEGGRSLHEVERQKRRVESEKEELANALDEAEAALEAEENRVIRANFELATLKYDKNNLQYIFEITHIFFL